MKVTLIDYTGKGMHQRYAAELLIFTKNTRLEMSASNFIDDLKLLTDETVEKELEYMSNTIPSSWEFVDYTFMIEGCDRGFTHQLVRTRTGSYAQQSMRVIDMSGFDYTKGPSITGEVLHDCYDCAMNEINSYYNTLIENGAAIEDARGVLPTNIKTNIAAKFDLRTVATMIAKRSSPRTQGMYRNFIEQMRTEILKVHPWAEVFLRNRKIEAAARLDEFIQTRYECGYVSEQNYKDMIKLVDILRGE